MSFLVFGLLLPPGLMVVLLGMERVERSIRRASVSEQLAQFLDSALPADVETFVSQGFGPALDGYWRRRKTAPARSQPVP